MIIDISRKLDYWAIYNYLYFDLSSYKKLYTIANVKLRIEIAVFFNINKQIVNNYLLERKKNV